MGEKKTLSFELDSTSTERQNRPSSLVTSPQQPLEKVQQKQNVSL